MDKHSTYYTVLEAIQTASECPFCRLEDVAAHDYFTAILYEGVNDPKVRSELRNALGYCHRHAHYLLKMRDSFGVAILYLDQIRLMKDRLALQSKNTGSQSNRPICPTCRNQLENRERYLSVFVEALQEPEFRAAYENSNGLCLAHVELVSTVIKDAELVGYLRQVEATKLNELEGQLQEFLRKQDYRFADEPFKKERDAWIRAINKLSGGEQTF